MAECTNCSYCSSQASPPHCPLCLPRYQALMHSPIGRISPAMVVGRPDMAPPLCHSRQFGLAPLFPTFCTEVSLVRQSRTVGVCQCALATHANYLCCAIGLSRIQATCVIGLGGRGAPLACRACKLLVGSPRMQATCATGLLGSHNWLAAISVAGLGRHWVGTLANLTWAPTWD